MSQTKVQLVQGKSDQTITGSTLTTTTLNAANLNSGAFSNRNLIINGEMAVAQRGTAEVTAANDTNTYRADRFKFAENTAGTVAMSIQDGTGEFAKCLKVRVTGTDTSVANIDRSTIAYVIEDLDAKRLQYGTANAKSVTLTFWVRSNAAQTYCINVHNSGTNNRTYIAEYTISSADTWEKKTLTIPGDTTGTWTHIAVRWVLTAGTDYQGSAGWQAWSGSGGLEMATSNQYNWMGATNDFHLTGVQLEVGDTATEFEHRSYGDELAKCQRYYQEIHGGYGAGAAESDEIIYCTTYPVKMRATPSVSQTAAMTFEEPSDADRNQSSTSVSIRSSRCSDTGCVVVLGNYSSIQKDQLYFSNCNQNSGGKVTYSAEL